MHLWGSWRWTGLHRTYPLNCLFSAVGIQTQKFGQQTHSARTRYWGYANPPWCLVGRCLQQVEYQEGELVMVTPAWFSQPWWPQILSLAVELPHLIPSRPDIMIPTSPTMPPLFENPPQLVAWKISGNPAKQISFQSHLQDCSSHHGENLPARAMTPHGGNGLAGVTTAKFLPFHVL